MSQTRDYHDMPVHRPSMDLVWDCLPDGMRPGDQHHAPGTSQQFRVDIPAVLAATDLVALIGEDVALRKAGRDFQAKCPFHEESTPSFTVSQPKQFYHCFGCGANGDALTWMQDYHRLSFRQALQALAGRAGLDMPDDDREAMRAKRNKAMRRELEAAAYHELLILTDAIGERVAFRQVDAATLARYPHIKVVPDDPAEREFQAAQRLVKALRALYGARA